MNTREFQINFERLVERSAWRNKFDQAFSDALWGRVKHVQELTFRKAVDDLLGQHNCPNVEDILNAVRRNYSKAGLGVFIEPSNCEWCDGNGVVLMQGMDQGVYKTAPFRCQKCSNGDKVKKLTENFGNKATDNHGSYATVSQGLFIGFVPVNPNLNSKIVGAFESKGNVVGSYAKKKQPVRIFGNIEYTHEV